MADSTTAMDKAFVKAAVLGLIGVFIAEMPFTKDTGRVTRCLEHLSKGGRSESHPLPLEDGMSDAVLKQRLP